MNTFPTKALIRTPELQRQITLLGSAVASQQEILSACLDFGQGRDACLDYVNRQAAQLARTLPAAQQAAFGQSLSQLRQLIQSEQPAHTLGLAVFVGPQLATALPFAAPLSNALTLAATADVFPLVQLAARYERHMLVLAQPNWLQVIEVDLGAIAVKAWAPTSQPRSDLLWHDDAEELPQRAVDLQRQTAAMERVLKSSGRAPLVLAGQSALIGQLCERLSAALTARLIGILPLSLQARPHDAAKASLQALRAFQSRQSHDIAARLLRRVRSHRLAVAGPLASLDAVRSGIADILVMTRQFAPQTGWLCDQCGSGQLQQTPERCATCREEHLRNIDLRNELVRLASRHGVRIELVDADELLAIDGVGCLLRKLPETIRQAQPRRSGRLDLVA